MVIAVDFRINELLERFRVDAVGLVIGFNSTVQCILKHALKFLSVLNGVDYRLRVGLHDAWDVMALITKDDVALEEPSAVGMVDKIHL